MVMFLALKPMESIPLNSFVLLENLAMLLTSFIDNTMIWYLNSKLDLDLSCAKDFRKPEFYGDFMYKL